MPDYTLTYTVTMPNSTVPAEKFRITLAAENQADAKVKLHRFVQQKVQTNFLSCELAKPVLPDETFADLMEAFRMLGKLDEFQKKYGPPKQ